MCIHLKRERDKNEREMWYVDSVTEREIIKKNEVLNGGKKKRLRFQISSLIKIMRIKRVKKNDKI